MSGRVIVSGPTGGAPNRLDIRNFIKNEKFFSLYILALQAMQKVDQSNVVSAFQIGGIHGLPYVPWNGVGPTPGWAWGGYCTHGSVLFPTWHRPYMMLYEQVLQDHAKKIAATYRVDVAAWKKAADELRQPYWDWAAEAVPPDEVIALKKVNIVTPDGKKTAVDNPLYHYAFHPIDPSFTGSFRSWPTTLRQPTSAAPDAKDDVARVKLVLKNSQISLKTKTYNMLTRVNTWAAFSDHTSGDGGSGSNSLEAIHDGIHVMVGGSGHMGDAAVAGFDPIFYLHHTNVDRLLSLWSALHPGVWVSPGDAEDGSFTIPPLSPVDTNTPLTPFYNKATTFWPSAATVNTAQLGYTYPEFNGLDMGNKEAVRIAIANKVNQLYGLSVFAGAPSATDSLARGLSAPAPELVPPNRGLYEWTARVECKQFEIPISYLVAIFLGEIPEDPTNWQVSPDYIGSHYAFVNSAAEACENCRKKADISIEGYVHLNRAIVKSSGLKSLDPEAVLPYLAKHLHWRVLKVNGEIAELKSLDVSVHAAPLDYSGGAIFPVAGKDRRYGRVTHDAKGSSLFTPES